MPRLIRDAAIVEDRWTLLRDASALTEVPEGVPVIVPLTLWRIEQSALGRRTDIGVWLKPTDDPAALAQDVDTVPLVAVDFPKFSDGRGYSIARLLRERHRFAGELRAIGDVLRDQLYYLQQCGFNAFSVRADRDLDDALRGLRDFGDSYQATVERPVPLFRRRIDGATNAVAAG
jgi:uncharacterized protein (DUF934 family)